MRSIAKLFFLLLLLSFSFPMFSVEQTERKTEDKTVLIAILARNKAHVLDKFLTCIENLEYDKSLITVYINTNNNVDDTEEMLKKWAEKQKSHYKFIDFESHEVAGAAHTKPHVWPSERFKILGNIRNKSMQKALDHECDYYFVVDCDNFIAPSTLKTLVGKSKPIIAPMLLSIPERCDTYSNYFCDITSNGYYKFHSDYRKILSYEMSGVFKVPVVHCTYLIDSNYIDRLSYLDNTNDFEFVIFSRTARENGVDQYICNEEKFGVLVHFHTDVSLEEERERIQNILLLP